MPNAFVSLGLVVLCAAAYMLFFQSSLSAEARRVQSIIDQKVKEAGGPQYVKELNLVSASASNMKHDNQ